METNPKIFEILNDLIDIHLDLATEFVRAGKLPVNIYLQDIFKELARDSLKSSSVLIAVILHNGGSSMTANTASGSIYRTWLETNAHFKHFEAGSLVERYEPLAKAIKAAYEAALTANPDWKGLFDFQYEKITDGCERIKLFETRPWSPLK